MRKISGTHFPKSGEKVYAIVNDMDNLSNQEKMALRHAARIARAIKVADIARDLTEEQILELVTEEELVAKLPVFFPKQITEEKLRSLASEIRRDIAARKILDQNEANNKA